MPQETVVSQPVKLLLDLGSSIDATNTFDPTALHKAAEQGHTEIVQLLLENNAKIDAKSNDGSTALHEAVRRNGCVATVPNLTEEQR